MFFPQAHGSYCPSLDLSADIYKTKDIFHEFSTMEQAVYWKQDQGLWVLPWLLVISTSKPVKPKGNEVWIFTGRTDAEAPILRPLICRASSLEKILMLGKIEGIRRRGNRGWDDWVTSLPQWAWVWANSCISHYLGNREGQGSLVCCWPWFPKESDRTEQLNNNHNNTLKWDSEFLLVELKNELHKQANTHSSKQMVFISRDKASTKLLA